MMKRNYWNISVDTENNQALKYKSIIRQYLSAEEIKQLHQKSNYKATLSILSVWLWIVFAFALVAFFPNVFTIIIALFIIGGKQLGCAIIMHDASHYSLFTTKKLNNWIGNIFGAYPIFHNVEQYRPYHFQHHLATGTVEDPDLNLVKAYPTKLLSLLRKFFRDLIGLTGIKTEFGLFAMHLGFLKYNLGNLIEKIPKEERTWKQIVENAYYNLRGPILVNLVLFLILFALGKSWLYLLWVTALLTTYNFCLRVRSIAEHSVVDDTHDPYKNTRTTYANFIEKILFAPLNVNYHLEHHFLQNIPSYNTPIMHQKIKERGFYQHGLLKQNYFEIIKMALKKDNERKIK